MKKLLILILVAFVLSNQTWAQTAALYRHKIALFTPLYLDSAFDAGGGYRYDKTFPKYIIPGLEFYQGAQAALDSLNKAGAPLEVFVYDSRSRRNPMGRVLASPEMKDVELIIGHASSSEVRQLADAARTKKVPFISATFPNDAGISSNPYYVILNSTLRTHMEGIARYVQKYHSGDNVILFRKSGAQENQIRDNLQEFTRSGGASGSQVKVVDIGSSFNSSQLLMHLDSTRKNVVIAGSLDGTFGSRLAEQLATAGEFYPITLVGMPTWEDLSFSKSPFKNIEIVYSTPFYYNRTSSFLGELTKDFTAKAGGRPTDMYYRGYETMLRFALLLLDTKKDVASNLTRKGNYVFTQFDIQPVFLDKNNMTLDYFENKKLYFVRYVNGVKTVTQ
jgi:ABC-type branched-subunit amino acid transport system substrate-binding protein